MCIGYVIKTVFVVSTRNTGTGTMRQWPVRVGTVVANVGRELSLLKMAIEMANANSGQWGPWNEFCVNHASTNRNNNIMKNFDK